MAQGKAGRFDRGRNAGTSVCSVCGRVRQKANMERDGGPDAICRDCWDEAGDANAVSDGYMTEADFVARYGHPSGYGSETERGVAWGR